MNEFAEEDNAGGYSIDKATAVRIACMTWKRCRFATNVQSGFKVCGLYPLSLVNMQHRMDIYTRNGTPADIRLTAWLHVELSVCREILTLPQPATKDQARKRKSTPVSGKILTAAMIKELEQPKPKKKARGKQQVVILDSAVV